MKIIFFDIESTGTSTIKDRIISLSAIKTDSELNIIDRKNILVNPIIPIPKEATEVNKITPEMVKDCPTFSQYAKALFSYFSSVDALGGFNIKGYDIPLLIEEFARHQLEYTPPKIIIDCYAVYREKEKRDLTAALKFYTGETMDGAHDAENDNLAVLKILKCQQQMYGISLDEVAGFIKQDTLDFDGKIGLNENKTPIYLFGKHKGVPVISERGFGEWMIKNDFSANTKNVVKKILYGK